MENIDVHTPSEWEKKTGISIIDPDGWRVDGKSFDEPITKDEWDWRMCSSTISDRSSRKQRKVDNQ